MTVAGAFVVALDLSIVNVAFPSIEASFPEVSTTTLSWVLSAYSVVFGALLLGAGRIADRSGRRRWFLRGVAVFTLGSLLCGVATTPGMLIGGRVVQAVGAALLMPASLALLLAATAPTLRAQAVAMWGGISALAVATGPSLGAVLIDAGGLALGLLHQPARAARRRAGDPAGRHRVRGRRPAARPRRRGDALARGRGAGARASPRATTGAGRARPSSASFAAVARARRLGRATGPRAPGRRPSTSRLFENRTVALANAATVAYAVGFFAMLLANVLFLTTVWEYSILKAGLAITPGPLVVAALSRSTGALAGRIGYRPVLVVGSLIFATAQLWCVAFMPLTPDYLGRWLPASLLTGLGVALTFPVLSAAAVAGLPAERFGVGGALNQTARQMGAVLGVALLVSILGTPASPAAALDAFQNVWLMCAGAAFVAAPSPAASAGSRPRCPRRWPIAVEPVTA